MVVSGQTVDFTVQGVKLSNVYLDGCPAATQSQSPCVGSNVAAVYTGQEMSFNDNALRTYTGLLAFLSHLVLAYWVLSLLFASVDPISSSTQKVDNHSGPIS